MSSRPPRTDSTAASQPRGAARRFRASGSAACGGRGRGGGARRPRTRADSAPQAAAAAAAAWSSQAPAEAEVGEEQAQRMTLLVKLYQQRGQHHRAAAVLLRLAERDTPPGGAAAPVDLEERTHLLDQALLQARAGPLDADGELLHHIQLKQKVVGFQRALFERLRARARATEGGGGAAAGEGAGGGDGGGTPHPKQRRATLDGGALTSMFAAPLTAAAEALRTSLKPLEELYNQYAQVHEMWDLCLEMIEFSALTGQEDLVLSLWDKYLHPASQEGTMDGPRPSGATVVAEAARRVAATGGALYPGRTFPLVHVAQRLELLAAGLWPHAGALTAAPGAASAGAVAGALVEACHGAAERVLEAYNVLLAQHGPMANPAVQAQLLRSVHAVLAVWAAQVGGSGSGGAAAAASGGYGALAPPPDAMSASRQMAALAERCRVYKTLVPGLHAPADDKRALEAAFEQLRARLAPPAPNGLGSFAGQL